MDDDKASWWKPLFRNLRPLEAEEEILAKNAYAGLLQGDLVQFAAYLKAGYELHPLLRRRLVAMIEGDPASEFIVTARKVRPGPGNSVSRVHAWARRQEVASFVRELERTSGKLESAVQAACDEFGVSRSYVFGALEKAERLRRSFPADHQTSAGAIESTKSENSEDREGLASKLKRP